MQLFAVSRQMPDVRPEDVAGALLRVARSYPRLDPGTLVRVGEPGSPVCAAALSHGGAMAGRRSYTAQRGDVSVFFDGRPVDRDGALEADDAGVLLDRWDELPGRLDGIFSAVRVDAAQGVVECLLDTLGLAQVYVLRRGRGWAIGNNVEVLRLLGRLDRPDFLGVSSLLTLGWAAGGTTLLDGVRVLEGGHVHRLGAAHAARPLVTPASVVPRDAGPPIPAGRLAAAMTRTLGAAVEGLAPVTCGLTGGRDSRVVLSLARAAGVDARYFTTGHPDDPDARIASELAARLGLRHEIGLPALPAPEEWMGLTARFTAQTDGLATLWYITDWMEHQRPVDRLGVKLWGAGGEIGRSALIGIGIPFMANAPLVRRSWRAQRWVLDEKIATWNGLLRPAAVAETEGYLRSYLDRRRAEGWTAGEALESYYGFERVRHWAAAGVRRAAEATDTFSPFITADFVRYCFALDSGQRYREYAHYALLSSLAPDLRDLGFDRPWTPQRPRGTNAQIAIATARWARSRVRGGSRRWSVPQAAVGSYAHRWLEAGLPAAGERALAQESSPLWELVDRHRLEQLLAAGPDGRSADAEGLARVLTAFTYFHERPAT